MKKFRVRWEPDPEQQEAAFEALSWKPYGEWLHNKLHSWATDFGHSWAWPFRTFAPHDWLCSRKWYRAWGRRRDIFDDSWIRKITGDMAKDIDNRIVDEIERKIKEGELDGL